MRILFVCLGNICRSPIAEGVLKSLVQQYQLDWTIESAGTNGLHTGEAPHASSQRVCKEHGIDISSQRSCDFTLSDWENYDFLFAMATDVIRDMKKISGNLFDEKKVKLFLNEVYPDENRNVTDPWYGGLDGYYTVYDEIEKGCRAIIEKYR